MTTIGRCFEDLTVGLVMRHANGRTVLTADNVWFTLLTMNTNPIHLDAHYASQTEFGKPLVNSTFILALITGLSVNDVSRYAVNLGWSDVKIPAPVFEGDTIYAETEVLSARESGSRPNMGVVEVKTTGFNQDGTVVMEFRRTVLVFKRGREPVVGSPAFQQPNSPIRPS
jgi:itaconyl-CoA hydratase